MAVSCVLWEGHSYHGPMSCCVPEPSGDGTWEPDVVPSGGVFSYSIYFRLAVPPIRPFVTAELRFAHRRFTEEGSEARVAPDDAAALLVL